MTITAAATGTPIPKPNVSAPFVDLNSGALTQHGITLLSAWYNFMVGMNRVTPCNASTTSNVITLTPLTASPLIEGYRDFEIFGFVADATTTNNVTMTVVPKNGVLSTLKAYRSNGATQAGNGDVVSGSFYLAVYCDHLDTAAGGFVLK